MLGDELVDALEVLGQLLSERGCEFDLVVVGGGALLLRGLIARPTLDLDVVARVDAGTWISALPFPGELAAAVSEVGAALDLAPDWLNPGPTSLLDLGLPTGFAERASKRVFGGLTLRVAGREDQIAFKVYAAADEWPHRGKHLQDLRALEPTNVELLSAARWCRTHDPSPGFRDVLLAPVLATFGVEVPRDD